MSLLGVPADPFVCPDLHDGLVLSVRLHIGPGGLPVGGRPVARPLRCRQWCGSPLVEERARHAVSPTAGNTHSVVADMLPWCHNKKEFEHTVWSSHESVSLVLGVASGDGVVDGGEALIWARPWTQCLVLGLPFLVRPPAEHSQGRDGLRPRETEREVKRGG